ncbi:MAG: hypothetical protein H6832_02185 [Planctomycetes bacterium]|nr:hypothetical protein [Planctomycetota bacterium]
MEGLFAKDEPLFPEFAAGLPSKLHFAVELPGLRARTGKGHGVLKARLAKGTLEVIDECLDGFASRLGHPNEATLFKAAKRGAVFAARELEHCIAGPRCDRG